MRKVLLIGALPESLVNFRGPLLQSLRKLDYSVTAMASSTQDNVGKVLDSWGVEFLSYPVQRNALSPVADLKTWLSLASTFRSLKPDVILAYTIKPVIWGGLASLALPNTRFYALITGLGFSFQGETLERKLLSRLVIFLYRIALIKAHQVIFQNPDNLSEFVQRGIVPAAKCCLVNGSGVDVSHFKHSPLSNNKPVTFLSIGRLLGEKGFREYVEAAKMVKAHYPNVICQLLGPEDPSPDGIPLNEVENWHKQGWIEYLGETEDVRPFLESCHIYVLPSYHEGMPRSVLEAMATGRPILTTDVPGCRETVINGENGYLVPSADAYALSERMIFFIENQVLWEHMGLRSRELAEEKYDVHKVNAQLKEIMDL